ncbi:MAG TPA: MFS transporter [Bryobacteraceae bacterium]|jgi:ACS family 4-hydroxyphenylacetate permease-like MFS transporter|nr:MFS transporter [Bryobacteraceae bacterium]
MIEDHAVRKVSRRLLWFLLILYAFSYLDRINIGFVALPMNHDLRLTSTQFGAANTIFYLGYILCEIPSNLMLARFGARVWLSRIMITWGIASAATMFATDAHSLYAIRFVVGLTEGGFLPGVLLYLTLWFPKAHRAKANALFMIAQPLTIATGALLSDVILNWNNPLGIEHWRILFLAEGLPSTILGIIAYFYLIDNPQDAKWLTADEKDALARSLDPPVHRQPTPWREILSRKVILLSIAYFGLIMTLNTIVTWTPTIVREFFKVHAFDHLGLLTALPAIAAAVSMPLWSAHSDQTRDRKWHIAAPLLLAALGWIFVATFKLPDLRMLGLIFCSTGGFTAMTVLWTVPQALLSPAARPAGIAFISSCGILASMATPLLIGFLRDFTHSFVAGLFFLAFVLIGASALVLAAVRKEPLAA